MECDAVVVGAGPNGLAAAITLAKAGLSAQLYEAAATPGGGMRTAELTESGFLHDICSAVHPMALASPFFRSLDLKRHGLNWILPTFPVAHPLDTGNAAILDQDLNEVVRRLGADGKNYEKIFSPWIRNSEILFEQLLSPPSFPKTPLLLANFGLKAMLSAKTFVHHHFSSEAAKALFSGIAAHSFLALDETFSSAIALVLSLAAHVHGWPIPQGGSQKITSALVSQFEELGGKLFLNTHVKSIDDLPKARLFLFDVSPRQLSMICKNRLPEGYTQKLLAFRKGPGVFKMDFALSATTPWKDDNCAKAATVHLGGTFDEVALSEKMMRFGKVAEKPFVLAAQPSPFDETRAPKGKHVLWAYCHVPNGSSVDMSKRIVDQIERFAPGFRDCILATHTMSPLDFEKANSNLEGGDISGGSPDWRQIFFRPRLFHPYRTPAKGIYLCSASSPPGAGVHGMCGYHAARLALRDLDKGL